METTEAVKNAGSEAATLVKSELALAKRELQGNLRDARGSALALGSASILGLAGMELLLGSVIVAGRRHPSSLALLGVACLGGAVALGQVARRHMPELLERTRQRAAEDTTQIAESLR